MRILNKPKVVVTDDGDETGGKFTAEQWPAVSVADVFFGECHAQCDAPCGGAAAAAVDDADPVVPRVLKSRFSEKAAPCAPAASSCGGDCYVCMDRDANSVLLPCGHSGVCYECAIENVARCETCPCCRRAVDQVVVIDRASRHGAEGRVAYRVIGPGPLKAA